MTENENINTYCNGFKIRPLMDIKRKDIINICKDLSILLNDEIEPEPIGNGFLYFKNKKYKSMRLFGNNRKNPWINETVMTDWKDDNSIYLEANKQYTTFLKGFYNEVWCLKDLKCFEYVFEDYQIKLSYFPKNIT